MNTPDPNPGNDEKQTFEVNHRPYPSAQQMALNRKPTYAEIVKMKPNNQHLESRDDLNHLIQQS